MNLNGAKLFTMLRRTPFLIGGLLVTLAGWSGCGPGIQLFPSALTDGVIVMFSSKSDLSGTSDGTPTESENLWYTLTNASIAKPLTLNSNSLLGSFAASLSPDGSRVAFHSFTALDGLWNGTGTSSYNIWLMNSDGTGMTPLTRNTASSLHSRSPNFSPDCTRLVFTSNTALSGSWDGTPTGSANIWVIGADGSNPIPLTGNTATGLSSFTPVFSPDGSKIAFSSMTALSGLPDGTRTPMNIWIMNADGTGLTALTRNTNTVAALDSQRPVFSPDGTKILFSSAMNLEGTWDGTPAGTENIWIMNIDGSDLTPLTKNQGVTAPSMNAEFSPDGAWITFQSRSSLSGTWSTSPAGSDNIWRIRPDGTDKTALTQSETAPSTFPTYTGDGSALVFWSRGALDGDWTTAALFTENLWVMSADGNEKMPLTKNTASSFSGSVSTPAVLKNGSCQGATP